MIDRVLRRNVEPRKNRDYDEDKPRKNDRPEYEDSKAKGARAAPKYVEKRAENGVKEIPEKKKTPKYQEKVEKEPEPATKSSVKYAEKKDKTEEPRTQA